MRAALLLLLLASGPACAQAGRFLLAAGEVTVVRGAREIRAAAGTAVEPGDTIRVGPRSNVQLRMSDQSIIALRSNTVLRIDEYVYAGGGADRSVFSLVKGGMRTVGGAIARQQSTPLLQTSGRPELPSGPQPAPAEEVAPKDAASESKFLGLIRSPLRTVAGALTPTRHAVRTPTSTIGVRGTHYTVVHCENDCIESGRTSVAATPNGTYGGVSNGLIVVVNNRDHKEIGTNGFFYVASSDSPVQSLIGPPGFLYDRLEAQERNRGQQADETTANMANSGLNAESRPSDTPTPPAPPTFVVTEQRTESGALAVLPGVTPSTAFLSAFTSATGGADTHGAFVDASQLTTSGGGPAQLDAFSVLAGAHVNPAVAPYSGTSAIGSVVNETAPNALGAYWGVWFAGSVADGSGTTSLSPTVNKFHYLIGPSTPPEVVAAKSGVATMVMVGFTRPTNNLGDMGSFTGSTAHIVDFTQRTVTFPITVISFPNQTWNFPNPSTSPIILQPGRGAFVENVASGSCSGGVCATSTPATLGRTGIFMGPAGDHLGVALHGRTTSGSPVSVQATQLLGCQPPC